MDKTTRTLIQDATQQARRLLEQEFGLQLEGDYNILLDGTVLPEAGAHLDAHGCMLREKLVAVITHHRATGMTAKEARDALLREAAFTTLNRFVALKMLEARGVVQECVSKGEQSAGFREFGMPAPGLIALPDKGYRIYLESLFDEIGREVRVLFDRRDVAGQLWPRRQALTDLLAAINDSALAGVWGESETIGWVYQYFNGEDERRKMRDESAAPRNSRELAVRNQFFTPSYVVAFLADNTLGRIWYEMRQGQTSLTEQCRYMLRRPNEIFLSQVESEPADVSNQDVIYVPYRKLKDPRQIQVLDPAVGSGHYLLYCFDLLLTIYQEAWDHCPDLLVDLRAAYQSKSDFTKQVPGMILRHNLHGVDIDARAAQIAELALWMRAQRTYADMSIRGSERPAIRKTNIVVAEPMPGEQALLAEFLADVDERLHNLVTQIWKKMQLAGEAGTLLKIEQEIDVAVRAARTASLVDTPPLQLTTFAPGQEPEQAIFTFTSAKERQFWDQAEPQLLNALRDYAQRAAGADGTRRWLFAGNAAQGFAFIDACRRRYDVVLMNPPFGSASKGWKAEFERAYPRTKNDLYAAFVERGLDLLSDQGLLGAITSRTGFFQSSYRKWRQILLHEARPVCLADLGSGVLDQAMVETAAYCLRRISRGETTFVRLLADTDKENVLHNAVNAFYQRTFHSAVYTVDPAAFSKVPGSPFAYWVGEDVRQIFVDFAKYEQEHKTVRVGLQTSDDFRFVRTWWEISPQKLASGDASSSPHHFEQQTLASKWWCTFAKGGHYSPYYADISLVVSWRDNGKELKAWTSSLYGGTHWSKSLRNIAFYFNPGLTYPRRLRRMAPVPMPRGTITSVRGTGIYAQEVNLRTTLGLFSSVAFDFLVKIMLGRFEYPQFDGGTLNITPVPELNNQYGNRLGDLASACIDIKQGLDTVNEVSHIFWKPALLQCHGESLNIRLSDWQIRQNKAESQLAKYQSEIDEISFQLYDIVGNDRETIKVSLKQEAESERKSVDEKIELDDNDDIEMQIVDNHEVLIEDLISYTIGSTFGRWDIRCATGVRKQPELPNPFEPLPAYSPGMLQDPIAVSYPLTVRDILVDDEGHQDDIIAAVREVLRVIWGEGDEIYQEATALLVGNGSDNLRAWLRGNFFEKHIKRYTKSRRAPIYWCLSTPSRRYAVWLYYHRINKDTFYRVLKEYVEPKIQLEERRLAKLRADAGPNPAASQRDVVDKQEQFVAELQTFRDDIARVAPLLNPDLDDGVLINFAPLWRLVASPRNWQKDCRQTWDALVRGDYDWSALAMRLWPERVVVKCIQDRSLAIAHGLDEVFWHANDNSKATPRPVTDAEIRTVIAERTSPAVQAALKALNAAPAELEKPKKRTSEKTASGSKRGRRAQSDMVQTNIEFKED